MMMMMIGWEESLQWDVKLRQPWLSTEETRLNTTKTSNLKMA